MFLFSSGKFACILEHIANAGFGAHPSPVGKERPGGDEVCARVADELKPSAEAARAVAAVREHQVVAVALQARAAAVLRSRARA